ncbi:MAG: PEP/pyruvate-binding domain-containing protein [Candidatus Hermodarchaeota archaeon]
MIDVKSLTIDLSDFSAINLNKVGSKAANLNKLIQYKFNVPEAYIILTNAYDLFLIKNNLRKFIDDKVFTIDINDIQSLKRVSKEIRNEVIRSSLPIELENEIKAKYSQFDSFRVAIRSSAIAEDLPTASFAGQYDSYLNIKGQEQILDHIKKCYASLWTERAISYRRKNKISHKQLKIAVIVQRMIHAKCSGVLFTANPISLNNTEIIIESNFGLGESVVSGLTSPDHFIIQRRGKYGKEDFTILTRRIGNKKLAVRPKYSNNELGVKYFELSEQEKKQASISDKNVIALAKIGTQIEKIFKRNPQDIEWAINNDDQIYIIQTRPITAPKSPDLEYLPIYSRGYSDDYWNDNTTPLFFNLLGDPITNIVNMELNSVMGYKRMDEQLLKLFHGHVYFNLNVIKRKVEYEIPTFIRTDDVLNYFPEGSGPYGKKTMKNLPFRLFKRLLSEIRVRFFDPDGSMSKTDDAYERWTKEIFNPYCNDFDFKLESFAGSNELKPLFDLALELDSVMIKHYRLIRYGIPVHNLGMSLLTKYLLTRFLGEKDAQSYYSILISGLNHKLTETNERIHNLVFNCQKSEILRKILAEKKSDEIYNYLLSEQNPIIKEFLYKFNEFLEEFGDRGFTRELYYPRWREAPELVFDILKSLIKEKWENFEEKKKQNLRKRKEIEFHVESKIKAQNFGLLKWKLFSTILKNSRKYIKFRENQRFNLDKWITRHRKLFLEIAKILENRGILNEKKEIFFLYKNEIKNIINDNYDEVELKKLSELAKRRHSEFLTYENVIPPKFLLGLREFNDTIEFDYDSDYFYGIPASQGIVTATARVLNEIDLIPTVQSGEILIVPKTDPGWTPVFSKIGGLITETGGILSHGAVVSREYGIPAVTNIPNACTLFKTGQILTLNGFNGNVILKKGK